MKVLNGLVAFLLVLNLNAQDRDANYINYMTSPQAPKVVGKGDAVEELRTFNDSFKTVIVGNGIQLAIFSGEDQNMKVVAQNNILPLVKSEIIQGTLVIRLAESLETHQGIKVYLPKNQLSTISIQQGGSLAIQEPIEFDKLTLLLASGAFADCKINVDSFSCTVMGGSILNMSGKARTLSSLVVQGGSTLNGENFECLDCKTIILGASKCKMKVVKSMDARVENESVFTYIGNPTTIKKSTSLNGQIRQKSK
ncbi:MAG: DUF2807 domain-containing protein [Haliscomenobacter sp.]|uniref:GIN domain-containing protein n=1 Tax=Haliscomenobacter sp. TaxID=2717303 RepID=UPI0029AEB442|nr:DUF2807 domain-containing protein [Haliscomenobacter sp.]MDX2068686.1 DUF2807 domain-containing protein [Haliscomenobacter sp.]